MMVFTAQKRQFRVHFSPSIIKLAVPELQHSPLLGQLPLEHIVWRSFSFIRFLTREYFSP
jgi:hypothetical protein